jgi:hypothetical protein
MRELFLVEEIPQIFQAFPGVFFGFLNIWLKPGIPLVSISSSDSLKAGVITVGALSAADQARRNASNQPLTSRTRAG